MKIIKSTLESYLLSHVLLHFKRHHGKEEHLIAVTWVQTPENRHVINDHIQFCFKRLICQNEHRT